MADDLMMSLLEERILDSRNLRQTEKDLVADVVGEYIFSLMLIGHIPQKFLDTLEQDLTDEAFDFLKKKIYGSSSLRDYRLTKLGLKT